MLFKRENKMKIGKKSVAVGGVTIAQWKELMSVIGALPVHLLNVMTAPAKDRLAYFMVAVEAATDDVVNIVSVLTGLDVDYIDKNATVPQLGHYLIAVYKVNDFPSLLKNVQSVLNMKNLLKVKDADQSHIENSLSDVQ